MKWTRMFLAAVFVAAAGLAATAPAASAADVDGWSRWPCTTGVIDHKSLTSKPRDPPTDPPVTALSMPGALTCAVPVEATFAVAAYWPGFPYGEIDLPDALLPYNPTTSVHPFRIEGGITAARPVVICIVSDFDVRVACVALSLTTSGNVSAREVSTSDPLVARPALPANYDIDPSCGTCWRLTKP